MDGSSITTATVIDELYEFSAPCFFDFIRGESEDEARTAELWFETALTYAPSPFMDRIKAGSRSVHVESLCNFSEEDQMQKNSESSDATAPNSNLEDKIQDELVPGKVKDEVKPAEAMVEYNQMVTEIVNGDDKDKENIGTMCAKENRSVLSEKTNLNVPGDEEKSESSVQVETEACTPKPLMVSQKKLVSDKKHQTAKKIASMIRNPSALKPKTRNAGTPNLALENQAIKRQKLDEGRSRQILNVKPHNLLHKSKLGLTGGSSNMSSSTAKTVGKLDRKIYVREQAAPLVSMAEMMKKFQSSTRDLSLPHSSSSNMPPLKLTRPKEPEFETAQRMRPVRVKSTAELEEEMMAKIPKFRARPLNKKIFEAPPLPSIPKSTPKPPEFQEFHLETMARATKNAETSSVASTEVSRQNNQWKPHLTEPKTPVLQTSLRARPTKVKSSIELEQEELEKAPKFKARPLNKKIFESKGEWGIFCNAKKQVTIPQEFHFATHERIPPQASVFDLFDELSLNSESGHDPIPRKTIPNPFHLHTEERGAEKEQKFVMEVIEKQFEEERIRVPKANPYPYTTDYPVIPPKPDPKQCTKPEPFQLESLVRHEEEMKREMEERKRKEKEEALMRVFKAQPVLKEDPIPVPEKARKPLTQVQEFDLHVNHRAVERAEFDQKIKEKEMIYKRYREESEAARMIEEEKALKQLRRTMVPHARPLPKFDHPFCPQKSSKETTKPKPPRLRVLQRIERKKRFGSLNAPTSSPATLMR
ncbi:protein TPX2-like [Hibiscus syriacus]|uniref:protein TPX2-like n=1 Tax=Hibiscus syriacus TaxID=106335 RepID=UPI0019235CF4|nr:protein TPX2-like [Hibiscus syriacus]